MENYTQTDQQLHWLCQTLAKASRTFVPKKDDHSHTNLYFGDMGSRITGRWIETEKSKILLALNLVNLQFEWLNSTYQSVLSFATIGKMLDTVEKEIADHLAELGLSSNGFTNKLHFEIPNYPFAKDEIQKISEMNLNEWKYVRSLANHACELLLGYFQIEGEIRIWPHHFDTGIYVVTHTGMGIGFGLAMSDTLVGAPYFYMSGYPASGKLEYKNLPELSRGRWEIGENWQGAALPLIDLSKLPKDEQNKGLNNFLKETADWFVA